MQESIITIPLCNLKRSRANVRRTDRDAGLAELVASIEHHGLLQNLTVRACKPANGHDGAYEVLAGGRRLEALRRLARRGAVASDMGVPCRVVAEETGAELSLAENTQRAPLHPADQFEAFEKLHKAGSSAEEIASRFGVSPVLVAKRLKLAAVSPELIAAYRDGDLGLEQLMAFAVTDDHAAQLRLWSERRQHCYNAYAIRQALTESLVEGGDRRARFVGARAYEAAGGRIVRDLFAEDDLGYFEDGELLTQLAMEGLHKKAQTIREEGWGWVECRIERDYGAMAQFGRVSKTEVPLPDEDRQRLDELASSYDALVAEIGDDAPEEDITRLNAIEAEMDALIARTEVWDDATKASAGAIVCLDYDGAVRIERGLLRPGERARTRASDEKTESGARSDDTLPDRVLENLAAHRTAALQASLCKRPDLALDLLIERLVRRVFFDAYGTRSLCVSTEIVDPSQGQDDVGASKAMEVLAERHARLAAVLPEPEDLAGWLGEAKQKVKRDLLAYCLARSLTALWARNAGTSPSHPSHREEIDRLCEALDLDMTVWWKPTKDAFLARLTKGQIGHVVAEAVTAEAAANIAGLKKDAMAARAEELLARTAWLPEPLRGQAQEDEQATA